MKLGLIFSAICFAGVVVVGCAPSAQNENVRSPSSSNNADGNGAATASAAQSLEKLPTAGGCAEKVEVTVVDGARFVWDEGTHAYHYLTDDEMEARYGKAWLTIRETAERAYSKVKETISK